jgi:hypothetical protein
MKAKEKISERAYSTFKYKTCLAKPSFIKL